MSGAGFLLEGAVPRFEAILLAQVIWGIGATSYRGTHITVDLVWANVGPKYQRAIDIFATLVLLFVVAVQTFTLYDKVVTGGIIMFDEYADPRWVGARKAIDEFFADKPESVLPHEKCTWKYYVQKL